MNQTKQNNLLLCFQTGKYRVNKSEGYIESRVGGIWRELKSNILPAGYKQVIMFAGRGTGIKVITYVHVAVYIGLNGTYPEGMQIDHKDKDTGNNKPENLKLTTVKQNLSTRIMPETKYANVKTIRKDEIEMIRLLHKIGASQSSIAKVLMLNRLSVRYIIKQIESGKPLKYENPIPTPTPPAGQQILFI